MELCDINLHDYTRKPFEKRIPGLMIWEHAILHGHAPFVIFAILQQILAGIVYIHNLGEVHRDLTPQNGYCQTLPLLTISLILFYRRLVENCGFRHNIPRDN